MPSPPKQNPYAPYRAFLLKLARAAMTQAVEFDEPAAIPEQLPDPCLREHRATFVTLERQHHLRGCIGRIEAVQPLVDDIAEQAAAAALHDPRFSPVQPFELPEIVLSISILSPPEDFPVKDEQELLRKLTPGHDGLILQEGRRRVTFLPSVWEELPDPETFVRHLKMKGGWPPTHWSPAMRAQRYTSWYVSEKPST